MGVKLKCIDVSEWQGNIDWEKVKASGIDYVILRAGFGREASQVDKKFEYNYKFARAAGLKLGAYWYSYADSFEDAEREAQACLEVIKGKTFELPIFYDMEEGFQIAYGKSTLTAMAKRFMQLIRKAGHKCGVYANLNWLTNHLDYNALYGYCYVWLAQYHIEAQIQCHMWQYTSEGSVPGISGGVDMNFIYSDSLVKSESTEGTSAMGGVNTAENFETAGLQALLMLANRLGIISQTISPLDNKKGKMTKAAILQMKKHLKMKEDYTVDLTFIRKTYQAIVDALPIVGDINGDGKVNIRDATALQKELAGIE